MCPIIARAIFGTIWARRLSCCWRACESSCRRGDVSTYARGQAHNLDSERFRVQP